MPDIDKIIDKAKSCLLPFESWERLPGESGAAYSAFYTFRNLGLERNIRKVVETAEKDKDQQDRRYRMWRNRCSQFRWRERAADYDRCTEKLKQAEKRETIEAQGEQHRAVTKKCWRRLKRNLT
ncbi:MAG: hypothetical protein LBP23_04305 [Treponema sp.]|jgi:hypothetical protein|nr:hypothetical protein [Treponema sp.]